MTAVRGVGNVQERQPVKVPATFNSRGIGSSYLPFGGVPTCGTRKRPTDAGTPTASHFLLQGEGAVKGKTRPDAVETQKFFMSTCFF